MRLALFTLLASVAAAPALAADLGTYRPGTPYHSTIVPTADVCASQCSGDARCRGWNYVKANPKVAGVCEFQSSVGAPISSAISISGINETAGPVSSRIVAGDTNTIRVGTSVASKPTQAKPMQINTPQSANQPRRIVRQPIPQRVEQRTQAASYAAPQPRPQFQPMLDGQPVAPRQAQPAYPRQMAPQSPNPQQSAPPVQQPYAAQPQSRGPARMARQPRNRQLVSRPLAPRQLAPNSVGAQQPMSRPAYNGRPPVGQTIAPPANYRPRSQVHAQSPQEAPVAMPRSSASEPITFQSASQSLYGRLHDDVRVPASNTAVPLDPNAPIPTASSRPVAPVQQGPLPLPAN